MENEKHENMLMHIARDFRSIDDLVEVFLSFLENKTDYFHLMMNDDDIQTLSKKYDGNIAKAILNNNTCGFKANSREIELMKSFRKHQLKYIIKNQPYIIENEDIRNKYLPPCDDLNKLSNIQIAKAKNTQNEAQKNNQSTHTPSYDSINEKHISTWNGGRTEKYFWNQSLNEVNLEIPLNKEIKPSEIKVEITNKHIKVQHLNEIKIEGMLYEEVNKQECVWNIEDKKKIIIFLEKKKENWWSYVIKGDPEIDTTKIESKKNLTDFDEKTQEEIRKMLYKQKMMNEGIKSPEELKEQALLQNVLGNKGLPVPK
ncbi:CS domain protein, putative [Plasmodium chabaudi adami]|uniref:Nuclear migration protein nudC n=1 Tax=Plasmodium chabaudi adami TaxID=5826 RepID=A0A1D3S334_PLACE|nr:CS domain protein, putative [Plasmodium chabaudi adami]